MLSMSRRQGYVDSSAHLQGELTLLNLRLHRQVLRWRATHHAQATPEELLGLQISDREVDALLDGLYAASAHPQADDLDRAPIATINTLLGDAQENHAGSEAMARSAGVELRLPMLIQKLELNDFQRGVVLLTLAPELDGRYGRLFKYLNDDATRPWPRVDLALQLFCSDLSRRAAALRSLGPRGALRGLRVVQISDESAQPAGPLLACGIKLEQRIVFWLLGEDGYDTALEGILESMPAAATPPIIDPAAGAVAEALRGYLAREPAPPPVLSITGPDVWDQTAAATYLADACAPGAGLLVLDGEALSAHQTPEDLAPRVLREVRLQGAPLAVRNADELLRNPRSTAALEKLLKPLCRQPTFLLTREAWSGPLSPDVPFLSLNIPGPDVATRQRLWEASLNGQAPGTDLAELADRYRLNGRQIILAAGHAIANAAAFGDGLATRADLFASCRSQSGSALAGLGQRVESIHTWDDLVLPAAVKAQLVALEYWLRDRRLVYEEWGFSSRVMLGRGLAVLFSGASGTGKTMAAGILARNLELDMYRIDLSSVVSKYIGETEKNLSRIFESAEAANAILFFDEADALFGKRSEVKDAHDRYANIEVGYLLQRMESYDGIAILCTNFRQNLDQAFARRMYAAIEFPLPNVNDRERIWNRLVPNTVPQAEDVDLSYLARQFALSGGNIKNCALSAAFSAAAEGSCISMSHLVQGVARELEKIGQPIVRSEFGRYADLVWPNA